MFADRVKETSATTGLGTYVLDGAVAGYRSFVAALGGGAQCYYAAEAGSDWEVGIGTIAAGAPPTLARTTILASSNGGAAVDWPAGNKAVFVTAPANWFGGLRIREQLTADRTYYVSKTGADSNDGRSAGSAFLTIQKALDVIATLDGYNFVATVQVGGGTYTENLVPKQSLGFRTLRLIGDTATPANVVLAAGTGYAFTNQVIGTWELSGFKLTGSYGVLATGQGAIVTVASMDIASTTYQLQAVRFGVIEIAGNYTISASANTAWLANGFGLIRAFSRTVTLSGSPAFAGAFAQSLFGGQIESATCTFSGAATGKRYNGTLNGLFYVYGSAVTYFPGNASGTLATNAQYA